VPRPKGSKNKAKWTEEAKAKASKSAIERQKREVSAEKFEEFEAKRAVGVEKQKREIQEGIGKILQEMIRRREEEAIRYYKPNRAQVKFHYARNRQNGICRNRVLQGSNKVGKTCAGITEDIAHALGYRPWLEPDHADYKVAVPVPNNGLILGETIVTSVDKKLVPELLRWLPKRTMYETRKNPQGVVVKVRIPFGLNGEKCGSTIHLGSYDQPAETQEGIDWGWVHYDEPPPHENYIAVERGKIAGDARSWMTMTPLKEPWILDQIIDQADMDDDISVTIGEIWDNAEANGGVLKQEAIDEFIKKLDPDEYEARILGKWKHLAGLVYAKWFKDEIHIINDFDMSKCFRNGWTPYESVDPHDNRSTCWLFGAVSPEGRLYCYSYLLVTGTVAEIVQKVRVKRELSGYAEPRMVVLDTLYNKEMPRLFFFREGCGGKGGPIYQMKRYSYDDMGDSHEKNPNPKPKDLNKDFPDTIRYLVMKDPKWVDPQRAKSNKEAMRKRYEEFVGVRRRAYGYGNEARV